MSARPRAPAGGRVRGVAGDHRVTAVIIGGGHAGLAMSTCLGRLGIDHVVLERGEVANSWRHERWNSLRLLTPNWLARLPGHRYGGPDPDGFMSMPEVIEFIEAYARISGAPVRTGTTVNAVRTCDGGYRVHTDRGSWRCRAVVLAHGAFGIPNVPAVAEGLPGSIFQLTPNCYRCPEQLPPGGVLVVGGSATGAQLAQEIQRSGRSVTLAVGEHVRMPRTYRGLDIQYWMQATGLLDETWQEVDDIVRARRVPSPQLVGTPERATLDLNALSAEGVALVGRLAGLRGRSLQFSGSLANHCALADLKLGRLLAGIDDWAARAGLGTGGGWRPEPTRVPAAPRLEIDLASGELASVIWATGYRPDYRWLEVDVFDARGRLRHDGGVIAAPGLYTLGLNFLRRRKSSFIHGAADDAQELAGHLAGFLAGRRTRPPRLAMAG